jgi:tetratricopeptide (TPR) repeat protein
VRALVHEQQKHWTDAIADYSKAIELDPEYGDAYAGRARAYAEAKHPAQAKADAAKAEQLKPK